MIKDNQTDKDKNLIYLYANNKDEQFAYIDHTDTTVRETITGLIEAVGYGGLAVFIGNTVFTKKKR